MDSVDAWDALDITTEFHEACINGDLEKVSSLLGNKKEEIDVKLLDKKFTLFKTMENNHLEIVKLLLEFGVNVNQEDIVEETALHKTFYHYEANLEMVQILLKHHANVNKQTKILETPLHLACYYFASPAMVEVLLENGASLDARDEDGSTPLHLAATGFNGAARKLEMLKILLQHNAEVDARNNVDETPLHVACEIGRLEIVQELLKHNPNVNAIATYYHDTRFTPIMLALKWGFSEIMEELLAHGAYIDFNDSFMNSSLNMAIERRNFEMVRLLLKNGCSTNTKAKMFDRNEDCTAFESSLYLGHIDMLKMLVFHKT